MPPVSAAPGLSVENLFGDLDPDEIIADEEDNQTPPPSTLGKRPLSPGQTDEDHNDDDEEENNPPGPESRGPRGRSSPGTQANPGSLRVEQVIRRLTKRLRLLDESISLIEQFAQVRTSSSLVGYIVDMSVIGILIGDSTNTPVWQCRRGQG